MSDPAASVRHPRAARAAPLGRRLGTRYRGELGAAWLAPGLESGLGRFTGSHRGDGRIPPLRRTERCCRVARRLGFTVWCTVDKWCGRAARDVR